MMEIVTKQIIEICETDGRVPCIYRIEKEYKDRLFEVLELLSKACATGKHDPYGDFISYPNVRSDVPCEAFFDGVIASECHVRTTEKCAIELSSDDPDPFTGDLYRAIFLVDSEDEERSAKVLSEAWDSYEQMIVDCIEGDDDEEEYDGTFGDYLMDAMNNAGITHQAFFPC